MLFWWSWKWDCPFWSFGRHSRMDWVQYWITRNSKRYWRFAYRTGDLRTNNYLVQGVLNFFFSIYGDTFFFFVPSHPAIVVGSVLNFCWIKKTTSFWIIFPRNAGVQPSVFFSFLFNRTASIQKLNSSWNQLTSSSKVFHLLSTATFSIPKKYFLAESVEIKTTPGENCFEKFGVQLFFLTGLLFCSKVKGNFLLFFTNIICLTVSSWQQLLRFKTHYLDKSHVL